MVLLQSCWSELLVLDHLCRQVAYGRDGSICLITGQQVRTPLSLNQRFPTLFLEAHQQVTFWMFPLSGPSVSVSNNMLYKLGRVAKFVQLVCLQEREGETLQFTIVTVQWLLRSLCIFFDLLLLYQIEVSTILSQAGATLSSLVSRAQDLVSKLRSLQLDREEFVCLKYLVLFNPGGFLFPFNLNKPCWTRVVRVMCFADVKSVLDRRQVEQTQEHVNRALMDHTMQTHPGHSDKFGQLLLRLPEVRSISLQVEEYLYQRHLLGDLPCNSLLTEMLHAKHTWDTIKIKLVIGNAFIYLGSNNFELWTNPVVIIGWHILVNNRTNKQ